MSSNPRDAEHWRAMLYLLAALTWGTLGWLLPVRWRSLHPVVVAAAGQGTPSISALTIEATEARKPGVARLYWQAAVLAGVPDTNQLAVKVSELRVKHPDLLPTGGRDETLKDGAWHGGDALARSREAPAPSPSVRQRETTVR